MHSPYDLDLDTSCQDCKLRSPGFFCQLRPAALKALDGVRHTIAYPKGAVLFLEGQAPRGVFILCKGRVKLSINSSAGKTIILRLSEPGEALGMQSTISGNAYQASAETIEPCQVSFVRRDDFLRFLRQNAEASIRAAEQVSSNYHIACDQIRSLGLAHSAPQKLARFLLEWAARGKQTPDGARATLALTHEEIGQIIGASRETVTRTLGALKKEELVSLHGSTLTVRSKAALESFAGC